MISLPLFSARQKTVILRSDTIYQSLWSVVQIRRSFRTPRWPGKNPSRQPIVSPIPRCARKCPMTFALLIFSGNLQTQYDSFHTGWALAGKKPVDRMNQWRSNDDRTWHIWNGMKNTGQFSESFQSCFDKALPAVFVFCLQVGQWCWELYPWDLCCLICLGGCLRMRYFFQDQGRRKL